MTKDPVAKAETKRSPKRNPKATAEAVPAPKRTAHTWPHDDVRLMVRAAQMLRGRNVAMLLLCGDCEQGLKLEGKDGDGAAVMGCACAVRRWL